MNTKQIRRVLAAVAILAIAATAAACSSDDDSSGGHGDSHDATAEASEKALPADVNAADVDFVQGMIPHHRQAVDMSELVIEGGSDPDTIALAELIKAAQAPEIDQMTEWLDDWGVSTDSSADHGMRDGSSMGEGDGMMSDEEMDNMASMSGADLEAMYLQMMIRHHQGAIEMAQAELENGSNPDVLALAQNIVDAQQAEIDRMNSMLEAS